MNGAKRRDERLAREERKRYERHDDSAFNSLLMPSTAFS